MSRPVSANNALAKMKTKSLTAELDRGPNSQGGQLVRSTTGVSGLVNQKPEEVDVTLEEMNKTMGDEVLAAVGGWKIPSWVNFWFAVTGVMTLQHKIDEERQKRADEFFQNPRPDVHAVVASMSFEVLVAFIIILNCMVLGWAASVPDDSQFAMLFDICEHFFVLYFLLEWILRVLAFGWVWIFETVNMIDTFMVFGMGVLPKWGLEPIGIHVGWLRTFTVLRAVRLSRLAKAVRFRPAFKELWVLIHGLSTSARPLMWTIFMAFILLYMAGMAAAELIGRQDWFEDNEYVQDLFGNLIRAMYTMFQLMTLDTWADTIARPVMDEDPKMAIFFVAFVGLGVFVFWNLITAIIVENASKIAQDDDSTKAKEMEFEKKRDLQALASLFLEIDTDGSGQLSAEEFFEALRNKKVVTMLEILEIQHEELHDTWTVLDDGDGLLTIKEFTSGIRRMRGQAKAKDIADAIKRIRHATASTQKLVQESDIFAEALQGLETECSRISDDTSRMLGLFHEMYHRLNTHCETLNKQDKQREYERKLAIKNAEEAELEEDPTSDAGFSPSKGFSSSFDMTSPSKTGPT